jgi:HPt (histidine-containing phosphotransfer) domain-containing protein
LEADRVLGAVLAPDVPHATLSVPHVGRLEERLEDLLHRDLVRKYLAEAQPAWRRLQDSLWTPRHTAALVRESWGDPNPAVVIEGRESEPAESWPRHPKDHLLRVLADVSDAASAYRSLCGYLDNESEPRERGDLTQNAANGSLSPPAYGSRSSSGRGSSPTPDAEPAPPGRERCRVYSRLMVDYQRAKTLSLKGHPRLTEKWLQERIVADTGLLSLGELIVKDVERRQPRAGRLDLLLSDPESATRYEIELQLGPTDETHIIRTIEYWDLERVGTRSTTTSR